MYQKFFRLQQRPFSATPDSNLLYSSPSMRYCLSELEQALRTGEGIGLLTAAAGTGKTLLCKVLAERLANDPIPVLLLNSTYATRSSLLQAVLFELGRPYTRMTEQELRLELVASGRRVAESQTGIALIVDEAHLLGEHILEELRALTNFVYQSRPVFRVVLSGQLAVEDILARRSMEAVNQRLRCHVSLERLTQQESLEYIITRVTHAGGDLLDIFSEPALELIVHAADGLPRCLNQLCDHACLLASVSGDRPVQPQHVREALSDLQKLPLHWNTPLPVGDPLSVLKPAATLAAQKAAAQQIASTSPQATVMEWGADPAPASGTGAASVSPTPSSSTEFVSETPAASVAESVSESVSEIAALAGVLELGPERTEALFTGTLLPEEETSSPSVIEFASPATPEPVAPKSTATARPQAETSAAKIADVSEPPIDNRELDELEAELVAERVENLLQSAASYSDQQEKTAATDVPHAAAARQTAEAQPLPTETKPKPATTPVPAAPVVSAADTSFDEELLEAELLEEIEQIRNSLPPSRSAGKSVGMSFPCREEVATQVEKIHDHYARLDAIRISQLFPAAGFGGGQPTRPARPLALQSSPEEAVGQAVLELCDHVSAGLDPNDEDAFPSPEQLLLRGIESQQARYDVVDPEPEASPYDRLYSELRRRKA